MSASFIASLPEKNKGKRSEVKKRKEGQENYRGKKGKEKDHTLITPNKCIINCTLHVPKISFHGYL
jgi:hypothetical protein